MPRDQFYSDFRARLSDAYPCITQLGEPWDGRLVVSPFTISIPPAAVDSIVAAVDNIFRLSRMDSYREAIVNDAVDQEILCSPAANLSVLMSYDFHLDRGVPRLLEINTNASGYPLAEALYHVHAEPGPFPKAMNSLRAAFTEEVRHLGLNHRPRIAIVDEAPREQKAFPEFLLFKSLFERWGWTASIHDYREVTHRDGVLLAGGKRVDLVYNRYCDFTLADPSSGHLRRAFLEGACGFSPNPREYVLLADKRRLVQMSRQGWLDSVATAALSIEAIRAVLVPTWTAADFADRAEVWKMRKQLFFKPAQSYGGKGAYRGESISRRVFESVMDDDTLIQAYVPAPRIQFEGDEPSGEWKYDLRAYAYGGEVQMLAGRIYRGQISNFGEDHGGYCPVFVR